MRLQKKAWKARIRYDGDISTATVRAIFKEFKSCIYCGSRATLTLEHIVSRGHGGTNDRRNLSVACHRCNNSKQEKEWRSWFKKQKFFVAARYDRIRLRLSSETC